MNPFFWRLGGLAAPPSSSAAALGRAALVGAPPQGAGDQPRAAVVRDERPCPLDEDDDAVAKAHQEEQVQHEPGEPRHRGPESLIHPRSATAAGSDRSWRANPCHCNETRAQVRPGSPGSMFRAACRPSCIAAGATAGTGAPS